MSYYEQTHDSPLQYRRTQQTRWQQSDSPQRYVNSYSSYQYSNLLQRQERALREQIAYEQAKFRELDANKMLHSSETGNENENSDLQVKSKFLHVGNQCIGCIGSRLKGEFRRTGTKKVQHYQIVCSECNGEGRIISDEHGKVATTPRVRDWDAEKKNKPSASMSTNRGTPSDSEEVSGVKITGVSKFNIFKTKRQVRREAWAGPGMSWNPFSKTTRRSNLSAEERLREAGSMMNESIPITFEIGHVKTAKNATPTQREFKISKMINCFKSNEPDLNKIMHNPKLRHDVKFDPDLHFRPKLDSAKRQRKNQEADVFWKLMIPQVNKYLNDRGEMVQDELFAFSSEQINKLINPKSLSTSYPSINLAYIITGCLSPSLDWYLKRSPIPNLGIIWVIVPTVYGKKWCGKFSSKQPFYFWNLHSRI